MYSTRIHCIRFTNSVAVTGDSAKEMNKILQDSVDTRKLYKCKIDIKKTEAVIVIKNGRGLVSK